MDDFFDVRCDRKHDSIVFDAVLTIGRLVRYSSKETASNVSILPALTSRSPQSSHSRQQRRKHANKKAHYKSREAISRDNTLTMTTSREAVKSKTKTETEAPSAKSNVPLLANNFPCKAFLIIEHCDATDSAVASWSDDGTHFIIKDATVFASSYLPRYFKHSNFQSFVRQLNGYGFRKKTNDDHNDGSVAFRHKYFQRGRQELLEHITRTKKTHKYQHQEGKKEKHPSLVNMRFDEVQEQMETLSEKLDFLISLVSGKTDETLIDTTIVGNKRRRQDSPISDITSPTMLSRSSVASISRDTSIGASKVVAVPRYGMDAIAEQGEYDDNPQSQYCDMGQLEEEVPVLEQQQAVLGEVESDDFNIFIDSMLDSDDQNVQTNQGLSLVDDGSIHSLNDSNMLVADTLQSKAYPQAVAGEIQMSQPSTSAVVSDHEDYDEEVADYVSPAPLTTAVEVTDATAVSQKPSRRTRKFIAVVVILVLVAFIVWPCVVFLGRRNEENHRPPPMNPPPGGFGRDKFNDTIKDKVRDNVFGGGDGNGSSRSHPPPVMRAADDPLAIAWNGESYECKVVVRPP